MAQMKPNSPQKAAAAEPAPNVKPMPFPGESPTVSLALAAGQMYGLKPEDEKPAAQPKRRTKAAGKKTASKPARIGAKSKAGTKRATPPKAR